MAAKVVELSPGQRVTCIHPVEAYYSSYCGNPWMVFKPGMIGRVVSIAPKVRIVCNGGPEYDRRYTFVVVDYDCPITNKTQRVGLDFCNVVVVESADGTF
jgi:hypothetical protein